MTNLPGPRDSADRIRMLLDGFDPSIGLGLEIGALTNPVVTPSMGEIRYLDHLDEAALRSTHQAHTAVDPDRLVPLDYAQNGQSIVDTIGPDTRFDYVVASHVIEHVPDPIRWLGDLHDVLVDRGTLLLAVPDKRRCFDLMRNATVAADLLDAYLAGATRPTRRQVFDYLSSAMTWNGAITWLSDPPLAELQPMHTVEEAWARARRRSQDVYDDVHCWTFTPSSFMTAMEVLQQLGLLPFTIERCTRMIGNEFFVTLRADAAAPSAAAVDTADLAASSSPSDAVLSRALSDSRAELDIARADAADLRRQLADMRDSRSWRLTRPIRSLHGRAIDRP
ncbi:MAG: hypothetical protein JWM34_3514 [Ilumatobacteraceae bacterium]|nr:hypothetical protein [Ilumatobacteraceae bacterium]